MKCYSVGLRLDGRDCVVVGGGAVAAGKIRGLLTAGARVTVIAPALAPELAALVARTGLVHRARDYRRGDLAGAFLAIAATDDSCVQQAVAAEAEITGVLVNVVDVPALCSFIVPAILTRGPLTVAVGSGGASPALAQRVRDEVGRWLGAEYGVLAVILGRLRERLPPGSERQQLFAACLDSPMLGWLRNGRIDRVDAFLRAHAGEGCSLDGIGLSDLKTAGAECERSDGT
jgi:precorrin-2 dehydrogenase/sirohydrochlorin ferrochelatase